MPSALAVPQGLVGVEFSSSDAPWLDRDGGAEDSDSNMLVDLRLALLDIFLDLVMVVRWRICHQLGSQSLRHS